MAPQWSCIINLVPQSKEIQMGFIVISALVGLFISAVVIVIAFGAGAAVVVTFFKVLCGSDDD